MSSSYTVVVRALRLLVAAFFRRIEVTGLEHLPADGGGVLVSWHPNGIVDPGLILTHFPRQVVFGARDGLFKVPGLGLLMRLIGTVPIYRAMDAARLSAEDRRAANAQSLDALASRVAEGSFSCLFPEGDSHDSPHLLELKTGAARFYYRARALQAEGSPKPVIIPVGLHYDAKRAFRSSVLVAFHPPLTLPEFLDAPGPAEVLSQESLRERCRALTGEIDRTLREVVHATENWELHHLMHRARKLVRAERARRAGADLSAPEMSERTLGFARVWVGYYERVDSEPEQVKALVARVLEYDADLRALGLEDHELDRSPRLASPWLAVILALQAVFVFLLLPPVLVVGYLVNLPPALALWGLSKLAARKKKDEASIKVIVGAVLFPATWAAAGLLAGVAHETVHAWFPAVPETPWLAAGVTVVLGVVGGLVALRYVRLVRETGRAIRVRLTRARRRTALARLRVERAELHDALIGLGEGLELPGHVGDDGRLSS